MTPESVANLLATVRDAVEASPLLAIVVVVVAVAVLVGSVAKVVEGLAKIAELTIHGVKSCHAAARGGQAHKESIKRKRQFLDVLLTDLAGIGKAEAWNDQQFTDLEAEVEIEGDYYRNAFRRLLKRKSSGLRRERSLIRAIDRSSEKCLMLTGDPGSGKSVALRHLAIRMIQRSIRRTRDDSIVPLYINLRELALPSGTLVTVDAIKAFVIDNMRRGDADTAEFIKKNWSDYQGRGIWFFLFDSFDEIPAVMHSPASDAVVAEYGRAIQQFMSGLNGCRGVLASRVYKSPSALSWPKLRILPLSEAKQEELIQNTFLVPDQKALALRAVSRSSSATYKNPLFLTLLCRYVRENLIAPTNEHELLYAQVKSLASRDRQYVQEKWGLASDQLMSAASELARLFAMTPELGLAPTVDEIQEAASRGESELAGSRLVAAIEALTYVKIGRTDVASLDSSVRRFAFAHRRYQECLFAIYLARNPGAISAENLIADARWRDYLVALLQIADPQIIVPIVEVAASYISERSRTIKVKHRSFYGIDLRTFRWDDPTLEHVLSVFLEAKRYSPDGPWGALVEPVESLLDRVWRKGDYYDRAKIMKYCGIGGQANLLRRIEFSMKSGIPRIEESAVDACGFLLEPTSFLSGWVRKHVIARIITSRRRFEYLRWEAVASELPHGYRMSVPLERAESISRFAPLSRSFVSIFDFVDLLVMLLLPLSARREGSHRRLLLSVKNIGLQALYFLILLIAGCASLFRSGVEVWEVALLMLLGALALRLVKYVIQVSAWHVPDPLRPSVLLSYWMEALRGLRRDLSLLGVTFIVLTTPGVLLFWGDRLFGWWEKRGFDLVFLGSAAFFALLFVVGAIASMTFNKKMQQKATSLLSQSADLLDAVNRVESGDEIVEVCRLFAVKEREHDEVRPAISFLSAMLRILEGKNNRKGPAWLSRTSETDVRSGLSSLLHAGDPRT